MLIDSIEAVYPKTGFSLNEPHTYNSIPTLLVRIVHMFVTPRPDINDICMHTWAKYDKFVEIRPTDATACLWGNRWGGWSRWDETNKFVL